MDLSSYSLLSVVLICDGLKTLLLYSLKGDMRLTSENPARSKMAAQINTSEQEHKEKTGNQSNNSSKRT